MLVCLFRFGNIQNLSSIFSTLYAIISKVETYQFCQDSGGAKPQSIKTEGLNLKNPFIQDAAPKKQTLDILKNPFSLL